MRFPILYRENILKKRGGLCGRVGVTPNFPKNLFHGVDSYDLWWVRRRYVASEPDKTGDVPSLKHLKMDGSFPKFPFLRCYVSFSVLGCAKI